MAHDRYFWRGGCSSSVVQGKEDGLMPHLNVIEHIQPWPHVARMRKRQGRRLKPIRPDHSAELWYRSRLSDLVHHTITVCKAELPGMLRGSWPTVMDAEPVDRAMRDLKAKHLAGLDQLAKKWSSLAVQKALSGVDTRLANELRRSLGVNVAGILTQEGRIAGEVKKFLVWNTELITSIPEELLGKVGAAVNQAFTSGQRAESLSSLIDDIGEGESGEARARLIARDQLNKMNAGSTGCARTILALSPTSGGRARTSGRGPNTARSMGGLFGGTSQGLWPGPSMVSRATLARIVIAAVTPSR
jgi:hypothetical protein